MLCKYSIVAQLVDAGWQKELEYNSTRVALQQHRNVDTGFPFTETGESSISYSFLLLTEACSLEEHRTSFEILHGTAQSSPH